MTRNTRNEFTVLADVCEVDLNRAQRLGVELLFKFDEKKATVGHGRGCDACKKRTDHSCNGDEEEKGVLSVPPKAELFVFQLKSK